MPHVLLYLDARTGGHGTVLETGMDWQGIGAALGGVAAMFGGVKRFAGKGDRLRARIEKDLELLERMEKASVRREALEQHVDASVSALVAFEKDQDQRRTDPYGLIWVVLFMGAAAGCTVVVLRGDYDWWWELLLWLGAVLFTLFAMVGATITFRQAPKEKEAQSAP